MALKCRINEGYCFIHAGKLNRGKKVIRRVLGDVLKMQREKRGGGYCSGSSSSRSNSSAEEATGNELLLEHTAEKELISIDFWREVGIEVSLKVTSPQLRRVTLVFWRIAMYFALPTKNERRN